MKHRLRAILAVIAVAAASLTTFTIATMPGHATQAATTAPPVTPSGTPLPTDTSQPSACSASGRVVTAWTISFRGEVTVRNNTSAPLSGWQVAWTFDTGGQLQVAWSARVTQTGSTLTAVNESWNGTLAPNASATFGYIASGSPGNANTTYLCTSR